MAFLLVGATSSPSQAATAAGPLPREWWFTAWGIQDKVWPITQGQGVTVGVVDTGVQASLPELQGAVLPGIEFADAPSSELVNGHFVTVPPQRAGDGQEETSRVSSHGTLMAELIAGQGRGTGFLGVAPRARILPVAITNIGQIASGIRYAVDHGAKVVNVSNVGAAPSPLSCSPDLQAEIDHAIERDVVVVASAGNSGNEKNYPEEPPACPGVLAVGALDSRMAPWVKTQRQPYVAVAAPGVAIAGVNVYGELQQTEGTSNAAALTSGAVALVRSRFPNMPARQVVQRVIASARDAGTPGKDLQTGYGAARPWQALVGQVPANAPNPVFERHDAWLAAQRKAAGDKARIATLKKAGLAAAPVALLLVILLAAVSSKRSRRRHRPAPASRPLPPWGPSPGGTGEQRPQPQPPQRPGAWR